MIIIKSEVWTITHCLGLGHETMASAVCLSILLWISNHMLSAVCDEITYPFPNSTVEVWVSNFIQHFKMNVITYPCMDYS